LATCHNDLSTNEQTFKPKVHWKNRNREASYFDEFNIQSRPPSQRVQRWNVGWRRIHKIQPGAWKTRSNNDTNVVEVKETNFEWQPR
jgi:hypothetical protein